MSSDNSEYVHLEELGGSKFEIVDGEPNIKGWDVKNDAGENVGEVDELLFDPQSMKVRYLVVDLDTNDTGLEDKKVLVPIGVAELRQVDNCVRLNHVSVAQLNDLPEYEKGKLSHDTERRIRNIFEGGSLAGAATGLADVPNTQTDDRESFYRHNHFNEDNFYNQNQTKVPIIEENLEIGKQEVNTGRTRIRSKIVERPVKGTVNLKEEHVSIERTPVDRPISDADVNAFKEQEFEITEHAEIPVVNKEARVVEEITINKDVEVREETIHDTLRSTEVDAEKIDPLRKDLPGKI
jgi:stress response protein YsnF/sporulation protein YlmC with PRC-barrel domain